MNDIKHIKFADGNDSTVYLKLSRKDTAKTNLKFTDSNVNVLYPTTISDSVKQINLSAPGYEGTQEITATYTGQDSGKQTYTAGKLEVVTYDNGTATHNVVIVPVNGAQLNGSSTGLLQAALNNVYAQACETFAVSLGPSLTFSGTSFDANPSDAVSYTDDMSALIENLKDTLSGTYNADNFYLFVLGKYSVDKAGIMPFNQNFGFIFVDNQSGTALERTIAHEIGHGAFGLLHTFHTYDNEVQLDSMTTDNLMDYAGGTHLFKYQWDEIHEPVCYTETCYGTGTTGEDAAYRSVFYASTNGNINTFDNSSGNYLTFFTPAGKPISFKKNEVKNLMFGSKFCPDIPTQLSNQANISSDVTSKSSTVITCINSPSYVLTNFNYNGDNYIGVINSGSFTGYCKENDINQYYNDTYSPSQTNIIKIFYQVQGSFSGTTMLSYTTTNIYVSLKNLNYVYVGGHYRGTGSLICSKCNNYWCKGKCDDICTHCQMPKAFCYCTYACICPEDNICGNNRFIGAIGVPKFENGELSILKFKYGGDDKENIKFDMAHVIEYNRRMIANGTGKDWGELTEFIDKMAEYGEKFSDENTALNTACKNYLNIRNNWATLSSTLSIIDKINNAQYSEALVDVLVAYVPYLSIFKTIIDLPYNENVNNWLINEANNQKTLTNNIDELNSLDNIISLANQRISEIQGQIENDKHSLLCTCVKH
jgi:hypothetical protein